MKLLGNLNEPSRYLRIADYFIESFPYGAGLGLIDCCRYGAIPIFSYTHNVIYKDNVVTMFPPLFSICKANNKQDYLELLKNEIETNYRKTTLTENLALFIKEGEYPAWIKKIKLLYKTQKKEIKQGIEKDDTTEQDYKAAEFQSQTIEERFNLIAFFWHLKLDIKTRLTITTYILLTLLKINSNTLYRCFYNLLKNTKSYFMPKFIKI